ncbi:MAG: pseudaminic acid cytidylyltransferase [Saprospiraceae bacterium]|nr:pseudaminic acid cytidylyltransferase [Saprospiraceae bacterium]
MANLCIIPARGGSKRIPRKNIKDFLGKPMISFPINLALHSGLFDEVMVSTEDEEIANIATEFGASVPFFRSKNNADDYATTAQVIQEVLSSYLNIGKKFERICCIYPCTPLLKTENIHTSYQVLLQNNVDSVIPVVAYDYPIQRALKAEGGFIRFFHPEYALTRSQDLEKSFHDAGQFYWIKTDVLIEKGSILTDKSGYFEMSSFDCQDIDTETDWKMAELKYTLKHNIHE